MISIAKEVEDDPEIVLKAPHNTRTGRVDEVTAARKPIVRWRPQNEAAQAPSGAITPATERKGP